jgi:FixJ family two-component response regulator
LPAPLVSVIDDDESTRLTLSSLLRLLGFSTAPFSSAEDFLQSDSRDVSCCIITDIQMPGLSGIELKQWLDDHASRVPVIMITARPEARLHAQALASGAVCLLKKPFDAETLLASLERANVR